MSRHVATSRARRKARGRAKLSEADRDEDRCVVRSFSLFLSLIVSMELCFI
jgi:hypothetical protein